MKVNETAVIVELRICTVLTVRYKSIPYTFRHVPTQNPQKPSPSAFTFAEILAAGFLGANSRDAHWFVRVRDLNF